MGHGIAQITADKGLQVIAYDNNQTSLDKGIKMITASATSIANKAVTKGEIDKSTANTRVSTLIGNITPSTKLDSLSTCDLIIEAGPEDADIKAKLYTDLSKILNTKTILASNTSGLEINWLATKFGRQQQVVGLHYFNPVQIMRLVEIIQTPDTPKEIVEGLIKFVKFQGKTPVLAADTPGFIVNRLLVPYLASAMALVDRKVATVKDIDTGMMLGASHPMGPLHLADYVGLDTCLYILQNWTKKYPNEPAFFIPDGLKEKVKQGKLGRKTGEGYYKWKGNAIEGPVE